MKTVFPDEWLNLLSTWAATKPNILSFYVFGSRAKGDYRPDSDWDLAVLVENWENDWFYNQTFYEPEWSVELENINLGIPIELWFADPTEDKIVWPAYKQHGILIYERK